MKMLKRIAILLGLLSFVSCGGYGDKFVKNLNDNGGNYSVSKRGTKRGYIVIKDNSTNKYFAVNYDKWKTEGEANAKGFLTKGGTDIVSIDDVTVSTGNTTVVRRELVRTEHAGYRDVVATSYEINRGEYDWYDSVNNVYYKKQEIVNEIYADVPYTYTTTETLYHGSNGWIFEETEEDSKDLEAIGADLEADDLVEKSEIIASDYGLSEERSMKIARLHNTYEKISSKRSLTNADRDIFSKEILGVDYSKAKSALESHIQGDSNKMDTLLEEASEMNEISPEHMTELLGEFLQ